MELYRDPEPPIAGLLVRQCTDYSAEKGTCLRYTEAVTDSQGRFTLPGMKRLEAFVSLMGDPIYAYGITVAFEGQQIQWSYGTVGYMPNKVSLECSVSVKLACDHTP